MSVLVVLLTVLSSFTTGQVNKEQLAAGVDSLLLDFDLRDGVTSTGSVVCLRCMRRSHLVTLPDKIEDLIIVVNKLLFKASYLNCVRFVLSQLKLIVLIQKIVYFATVDLVH